MKDKQQEFSPGIYMVATPIGNLDDITLRAVKVLEAVDWIAAEDTRQTKKLLDHLGIHKPLYSIHEHSQDQKIQECITRLQSGERGAYVSDAGTPGICDPGADLVNLARKSGVKVTPIPGASAVTTLLSCIGTKESQFHFLGFFPRENADRQKSFSRMEEEGGVFLFFESPHRFLSTLEATAKKFPSAELTIGRELTKHFETISFGKAAELWLELKEIEARGEYVIALALPSKERESEWSEEKVKNLFAQLSDLGANQKLLTRLGVELGISKNSAYDLAIHALKK